MYEFIYFSFLLLSTLFFSLLGSLNARARALSLSLSLIPTWNGTVIALNISYLGDTVELLVDEPDLAPRLAVVHGGPALGPRVDHQPCTSRHNFRH